MTHNLVVLVHSNHHNSSFKSLGLLLSSLSLASEPSAFEAEAGFWSLKGIDACFFRNLYNATTVRSVSTVICQNPGSPLARGKKPTYRSRKAEYSRESPILHILKHDLLDQNSCFLLGRIEVWGTHQTVKEKQSFTISLYLHYAL